MAEVEGLADSVIQRNAIAVPTRTVAGTAPLPNLLGEFAPALGWGRPDHLHRCRNGHLVRLAFHAQHGGEPLTEACSPFAGGIVLYREPADSSTPERIRATDIAASARPEEIGRFAVFLMAVEVADLNVASASAKNADTRSRRSGGMGAIPERSISDRFLTPAPPVRRMGQS